MHRIERLRVSKRECAAVPTWFICPNAALGKVERLVDDYQFAAPPNIHDIRFDRRLLKASLRRRVLIQWTVCKRIGLSHGKFKISDDEFFPKQLVIRLHGHGRGEAAGQRKG